MAHSTEKSARFKREQYFPQDWKSITAEFLSLFHRYAYICKPLTGGDWFSQNEAWALTDSEILKAIACAHPRYIIGCRPGRSTKYAVLDIDTESKYHNLAAVNALRDLLKQAGIDQTMVYRSSYSGGWHLYIFFEEDISSKDLSNQLNQLLKLSSFEIKKGTLEIFPQPGVNSNGQGLRLPLQEGFAWLDQKTLEVESERFEYPAKFALNDFIDALDGAANTRHQFHQMKAFVEKLVMARAQSSVNPTIPGAINNVVTFKKTSSSKDSSVHPEIRRIFHSNPPGIIAESWLKGRAYYDSGLTGPSQRTEAILCLGHYLFYGDPVRQLPALGYGFEQDRQQVIETILSERHYGNSRDINRNPAQALKSVKVATSWVPPSRRGGPGQPIKFEMPVSWVRHNANLKKDARFKIRAAVEALVASNHSFSVRDLQTQASCSITTLYKHQDLWKDAHEQSRNRLFASVTHDYIPGDYSVSPERGFVVSDPVETRSEFEGLFDNLIGSNDELAYRRDSKAVQAWIKPILNLVPKDLSVVDSSQLVFLIPTFNWFLSISPTSVCKRWLSQRLLTVRYELDQRFLNFHLVGVQRVLSFDRDMFSGYLHYSKNQGVTLAGRLCVNRYLRLGGKHPPPS